MSVLRALPTVAMVGAAGLVTLGILKLIDKVFDDEIESQDEQDAKSVMKKMKRVQNELARLSDLKELNDRRESTGQVSKTTLQIDGVDIDEIILGLTENLERLTKKYNRLNNTDGGKKRKKK